MGERISPAISKSSRIYRASNSSAQAYESNKSREHASLDNVIAVITNPLIFPWVERCIPTAPNKTCDEHQIDLITFTNEEFARQTGLDTITTQVKSCEIEMVYFLGVIGTNGKIHHTKFLHHNYREWAAASLTFLNGQWPHDVIAADFMYQLCALCGSWRDWDKVHEFRDRFLTETAVSIMRKHTGAIMDQRARFLDWVVEGVHKLEEKPL